MSPKQSCSPALCGGTQAVRACPDHGSWPVYQDNSNLYPSPPPTPKRPGLNPGSPVPIIHLIVHHPVILPSAAA